ncbi:MAG: aldehyde dehydrogenase family protein, partial [Actinobacteria bacterium]|nr:aldehyde dehydrogenase family protein [Actinomycetota bacterium]
MNFIAGRWVESRSGRTMQDVNPADSDDVLGEVARSNSADVDQAVTAAKA